MTLVCIKMAAPLTRKCVWYVGRFSRCLLTKYKRCLSTTHTKQIRSRSRRTELPFITELSSDDKISNRRRNPNFVDSEGHIVDSRTVYDNQRVNYEENERFYIPAHIKYETLRQSDSKFG